MTKLGQGDQVRAHYPIISLKEDQAHIFSPNTPNTIFAKRDGDIILDQIHEKELCFDFDHNDLHFVCDI